MMSKTTQMAVAAVICTLTATTAAAQPSVDVVTPDGRTIAVSFAGLQRTAVDTSDAAGIRTKHEGVLLRDVLAQAGIQLGDTLRGKVLACVVVATARDGYQVAFALAELDAAFNDHHIVIADTRNGRPLLADAGPLQIVVPQDKRPARWIRQVTTLEVRQLQ